MQRVDKRLAVVWTETVYDSNSQVHFGLDNVKQTGCLCVIELSYMHHNNPMT